MPQWDGAAQTDVTMFCWSSSSSTHCGARHPTRRQSLALVRYRRSTVFAERHIGAIETLQRWYWEQPPRGGFTDGRVDPLPVDRVRGPLHKFPYTIIGLSVDFGGAFGVDRHFRLGKEPNFPAELKRKLFF
jgi:hypothetical protein